MYKASFDSSRATKGKIGSVQFGIGGYQNGFMGLHIGLLYGSFGITDYICGGWSTEFERSVHTKWTETDRDKANADMLRIVNQIMLDAKVRNVADLVGKPVEVIIWENAMISWLILTEVL